MKNIPNCTLYRAKDVYGNEIQALVPFGTDPLVVFELFEDFDSCSTIERVSDVYASTIQAFLNKL